MKRFLIVRLVAVFLIVSSPSRGVLLRLYAQVPAASSPQSYAYGCPAGAQTTEPVRGVCAASFRSDGTPLDEFAIALGPREGLAAIAGTGTPLARVFVTTNGGSEWRAAGVPSELVPPARPGESVATGRVAMEFDSRGRIHLVAELRRHVTAASGGSGGGPRVDLYYASSSDLGATWTRPVMLDVSGTGVFPRLAVQADRVYVTWGYRGNYLLHAAWSADAGISWTAVKQAPNDCINVSEMTTVRGTPYVICAGYMPRGDAEAAAGRNPFTGLRLYRLDVSGELKLQTTIDAFKGVWPRLLAGPDGRLVVVANLYRVHSPATKGWDKCCAAMSHSMDGRTWSEPVNLREALRSDDGWDTFQVQAARLDSFGLVHIVADGSDQADPANGSPGVDARLVHAAFDPAFGRLIAESSLTRPTYGPQGYYPGNVALAFAPTFGVALWKVGDGLNYTRLKPRVARVGHLPRAPEVTVDNIVQSGVRSRGSRRMAGCSTKALAGTSRDRCGLTNEWSRRAMADGSARLIRGRYTDKKRSLLINRGGPSDVRSSASPGSPRAPSSASLVRAFLRGCGSRTRSRS